MGMHSQLTPITLIPKILSYRPRDAPAPQAPADYAYE